MVIHDYLSFTFCPEELIPYRKMAAAGRQSMAQFIKEREGTAQAFDVDVFDDRCRENLTTFLQYTTKDFFKGQKYTTNDAWFDLFTPRQRPSGMFGYRSSWDLYMNGTHIGVAAAGSKNGGCYVSFSGEGTAMLDPIKLLKQIKMLPMIKITRVDLAFDDFEGVRSCDYAFDQWKSGAFKMTKGGKNPKHNWHMSGGELVMNEYGIMCNVEYSGGRTFQVGDRRSGKLCRIYEKGKQLGSTSSKWTRWEVEIHSKDREIPLFVLSDPAAYFLGSYPAMQVFEKEINSQPEGIKTGRAITADPAYCYTQIGIFPLFLNSDYSLPIRSKRIRTSRKQNVKISYDRLESSARQSYGALINVMRESRGMTDEDIVEALISSDPFAVPRRLEKAAGVSLPGHLYGPSIPTDIAQERGIIPITDSGPWLAPDVINHNQGIVLHV